LALLKFVWWPAGKTTGIGWPREVDAFGHEERVGRLGSQPEMKEATMLPALPLWSLFEFHENTAPKWSTIDRTAADITSW